MDSRDGVMYKSNMVTINSAARFACAPDWSWDTGPHPIHDRDLWAVLGGEGQLRRLRTDGVDRYRIERGDVFLLGGLARIIATHDPSTPLVVIAVHFDGGRALPFHVPVRPVEFLAGILQRLLRSRLSGDAEAADRWLEVALDEIAEVARSIETIGTHETREVVASLCDRIRDRPGDRWRVSELAKDASVSPQHLSRVFRAVTGRTTKEYILEARMEAARAYLRGSSLPLKRIADELGFHDEFHFSRQFALGNGMSPSAYRSATTGSDR